jgi:hypothetical protein
LNNQYKVSKKLLVSIFRVAEYAKKESNMNQVAIAEEGGDVSFEILVDIERNTRRYIRQDNSIIVPMSRKMELYLHSLMRLHGVMLN